MGAAIGLKREGVTLLEEIQVGDVEWNDVEELIRHRSRNYHAKYKHAMVVKRLWRVRPSELFTKNEEQAKQTYGGNAMRLFHGTSPESAQQILLGGFQLPNHKGMFGKGIYFAKTPLKSTGYAKKAGVGYKAWQRASNWLFSEAFGPRGDEKIMLVCDVYLGRTKRVSQAKPSLTAASDIRPGFLDGLCCRRKRYDSVYAPGPPHACVRSPCLACFCCCCLACTYAVNVSEWVVFDPIQGVPRFAIEFDTELAVAPLPLSQPVQQVMGAAQV